MLYGDDAKFMWCRICDNRDNNTCYTIPEMMFGDRSPFSYFQCARCDCLQIAAIPEDMSPYYPETYYSYKQKYPTNKIKKILWHERNRYAVFGRGWLGKLLYTLHENLALHALSYLPITKKTRILDVGCGAGTLLYALHNLGCTHLMGVDPFNASPIVYENKLRIVNKALPEIHGQWDLIMFHHSFEHVPDPLAILRQVDRLLHKDGQCLIRIPTVSSYAWKQYGVHWVQADAPRHLYLHSVKSIDKLAARTGFRIHNIVYDSTAFQFWGSEQYKRNIPLRDPCSYAESPQKSLFSKQNIRAFTKQAHTLNREGKGDQAAFFLTKQPS